MNFYWYVFLINVWYLLNISFCQLRDSKSLKCNSISKDIYNRIVSCGTRAGVMWHVKYLWTFLFLLFKIVKKSEKRYLNEKKDLLQCTLCYKNVAPIGTITSAKTLQFITEFFNHTATIFFSFKYSLQTFYNDFRM